MKSTGHINQMLKYIDEHIEEPLTTASLAQIAGYSEYHFTRIFKSYMKVNVMEYVCKRRLIKASEELLSGKKVIDVAVKYGWQSHSGFTKAFTKTFGFCPSLLRAMKLSIENLGGNAMNHIFLKTTAIGSTKEELLETLQKNMRANNILTNEEQLIQVYQCVCRAYENVKRYSGEEYVTHPLNVSVLLTELEADEHVILAGMFCDVNKKGKLSLEDLKADLPQNVYELALKTQDDIRELSMDFDKAILIKLAERLHNLRTIEFISEDKKSEKAKETLELFMPLARNMQNQKLIDELNDLSLIYYSEN